MSRHANPMLIGAFVVGAIVLAVAAILLFGRGDLLQQRVRYVMFFDGSVQGLDVGAPVVFRGVKIGEVVDIRVEYNSDSESFLVPVFIDIDPRRVDIVGSRAKTIAARFPKVDTKTLIDRGLRGELVLQSFLTGQLLVQLDFYPDKPARLLGVLDNIEELPTIKTPIQELTKTLEDYPVEQVLADISEAMRGIRKLATAPELIATVRSLDDTLAKLREALDDYSQLAKTADAGIKPLLADLGATLDEVRSAVAAAKSVLARADTAFQNIDGVAGTADQALVNARDLLADDSPLVYELTDAARELANAARAVKALADTLERQPESILRGKR
jgi:paraquat-inducible protein B